MPSTAVPFTALRPSNVRKGVVAAPLPFVRRALLCNDAAFSRIHLLSTHFVVVHPGPALLTPGS